jgi:hypothetical protein
VTATHHHRSQVHSLIVENRDLQNLLVGPATSGLGDSLATVALVALVLKISAAFVGHLEPARVVLFASGVLVVAMAAMSGRWTKRIDGVRS